MKLIMQIACGILLGEGALLAAFRVTEPKPTTEKTETLSSAETPHAGDFKLSRTIPVCNKANLAFDSDDYAYCMPPTHVIRVEPRESTPPLNGS